MRVVDIQHQLNSATAGALILNTMSTGHMAKMAGRPPAADGRRGQDRMRAPARHPEHHRGGAGPDGVATERAACRFPRNKRISEYQTADRVVRSAEAESSAWAVVREAGTARQLLKRRAGTAPAHQPLAGWGRSDRGDFVSPGALAPGRSRTPRAGSPRATGSRCPDRRVVDEHVPARHRPGR